MSSENDFAGHESTLFSKLSKEGFAPRTIFDIGAADGTWSARIHKVFPEAKFHMFEPLASFLPSYQKNLQWHMQNHPGFTLHAIALGAENKQVSMRIHTDGYSSTTLEFGDDPEFPQCHAVEQRTLDDFVAQFSLPLPDLIKLDVQGSELAILNQSPRCLNHADLVFAETWLVRSYHGKTPLITELLDLLDKYEYDLADFGYRFYEANHRLIGCDAFFLKRSLLRRISPRLPSEEPWCP